MGVVETTNDGNSRVLKLGGAGLDSKSARKAPPGTILEKDGKFYKKEKQTSWEQVNHKEGGKLHVDSQTDDFTDYTKPGAVKEAKKAELKERRAKFVSRSSVKNIH
jgi:hypothetical protein